MTISRGSQDHWTRQISHADYQRLNNHIENNGEQIHRVKTINADKGTAKIIVKRGQKYIEKTYKF